MTRDRTGEPYPRWAGGLVVRGVASIVFGLALLAWPGIGLRVLVLLFGAGALVDGVVSLWTAASATAPPGQRWWTALQGVAGVAVAVLVLLWPGISAVALLAVIGGWALVLGAVDIGAALTAPAGQDGDRVLLGLHGVLGVTFGLIMWTRPGAGALALVALVAAFAIVTGAARVATAVRAREPGTAAARRAPAPGTPADASSGRRP